MTETLAIIGILFLIEPLADFVYAVSIWWRKL